MIGRRLLCIAVSGLAACAGHRAGPTVDVTVRPDDMLSEIITAAFAADQRLERADSLYAQDAVIVADGEVRAQPPRFAGVDSGGAVAVTASRLEVRGTTAWAVVEYRWVSTSERAAREGRATLVFSPNATGAWRIRHAHSSSPPPGL